MRKLFASVASIPLILMFCQFAAAQGITAPRVPSPSAVVSQTIGISTVEVNYSRPSVKGRAIWGGLVSYGYNVQAVGAGNSAPWRAGANENTVIKFSDDATVEGHLVPAGSYGLFFVINQDNTGEVILSKDYKSWGSFYYDPKNDLIRSKIDLREIPHTEMLTYDFINLTKNSGELVLNWEKKQFPVKIEFAVDEIVMKNAEAELKGQRFFNWTGFASAAAYALQNKTHYDEGLVWIDKAIGMNRNFTTLNTKTGLLRELNRTAEADKTYNEALSVATEIELNNFGYQLLAEGQQDKAIEVFIVNTQKNPKSANVWDSLGECYALIGDKKNAISNFKKSLSLNPPPATKANSEKYLKQLGAM